MLCAPERSSTLLQWFHFWLLLVPDMAFAGSSRGSGATSPFGLRLPPNHHSASNLAFLDDDCETGRLCVGPRHDSYPIGREPGVLFSSRFVVPPLPKSYDSENMTYYDYFNIFFRNHPEHGYFNQFVPQLMLGNVLANSTNAPHYQPLWMVLDTWHIGAQYFFALLCNETDDGANEDPCWNPYAATGKLVPVVPGEVVETTFELVKVSDAASTTEWEWHLRMGVVGAHPSRWSLVVARTPYMGLVPNATSWKDEHYTHVTVGSCLENYGMTEANNYPQTWEIVMDIVTPNANGDDDNNNSLRARTTAGAVSESTEFDWDDWIPAGGQKCSWLPRTTVENVQGSNWQRATWNATLYPTTKILADAEAQ